MNTGTSALSLPQSASHSRGERGDRERGSCKSVQMVVDTEKGRLEPTPEAQSQAEQLQVCVFARAP